MGEIDTIQALRIFFSPVIENWPIVVSFVVIATIAASGLIHRQVNSEVISDDDEMDIDEFPLCLPVYGRVKYIGKADNGAGKYITPNGFEIHILGFPKKCFEELEEKELLVCTDQCEKKDKGIDP